MVSKLRLSEAYLSIQGEGPRVGEPTVFCRFAGCNLRCPGWACDTPHAIDPALYRLDSKLLSPEEVADRIEEVAKDSPANICFTGGEPFLQNDEAFQSLTEILVRRGFTALEVFTNGTLRFPEWALDEFFFIMDYKLNGAGEKANIWGTEGVQAMRQQNITALNVGDVVKFTIADRADYDEAIQQSRLIRELNTNIEFVYGVVWGKLQASELIGWVLEDGHDWTYSHQLHNVIWDRSKRGI